jgi:hypothetical protein
VWEGQNRHQHVLRKKDSILKRNYDAGLSLKQLKRAAWEWNEEHCRPPLDNNEMDKLWDQATKFISKKLKEEQEIFDTNGNGKKQQQEPARQQQQHQQQQDPPLADLAVEVNWDKLAAILDTSIKKDRSSKLIDFCGFLLAQADEDQLNIGFQAESSAGKSYIPLELATYFQKKRL